MRSGFVPGYLSLPGAVEHVAERLFGSAELRIKMGKGDRYHVPTVDAADRLSGWLSSGEVRAFVLAHNGDFLPIPARAWRTSESSRMFATGALANPALVFPADDGPIYIRQSDLDGLLVSVDPRPDANAVAATLPQAPAPATNAQANAPTSRAGLALCEFERIGAALTENDTLTGVAKTIAATLAKGGNRTAPNTVEKAIRPLFKAHRGNKGLPPIGRGRPKRP